MNNTRLPYIIAIGASGAEGLNDIRGLLHAWPHSVQAIVLVVLHRPSDQISHLREILATGSGMPVIIAEDAIKFVPGACYIGEPDGHLMLMARNLSHLIRGTGDKLRNRTIDTLFNSVALHAGKRGLGIILSGSLDDGSRGLAAIRAAGGITMVLEPGLKPRGMQQNAIDYDGPINFVGTANQIAEVIDQLLSNLENGRGRPVAG